MPTELLTNSPPTAPLRADPYRAVWYHFGMLLGVDDLGTEQAYHRGQQRLSTSWLHGPGAVWGLEVTTDLGTNEVRIAPGLAYDGAGQALRVDAELCLDLTEWFGAHHDELGFADPLPAEATFDAHVVLVARACLANQVPAMTEPCDGTATGTAYSRVVETVEARLVPGPAPERQEPYHRLRLLFGLTEPQVDDVGAPTSADQAVLDARAAVAALAPGDQPAAWLESFRRFATADTIDLEPATVDGMTSRFAAPDDAGVLLASLHGIHLLRGPHGWDVDAAPVDVTVRPNHVATATVEELLCGPACGSGDGGAAPAAPPDAGGPRIDRQSVVTTPRTVTLTADKPLAPDSVAPDAFSVTAFTDTGWNRLEVRAVTLDDARLTVTLRLRESISGDLLRVIAKGTGPAPLLGADLVPLAGAVGDPPASPHDGNDFVQMVDRRA